MKYLNELLNSIQGGLRAMWDEDGNVVIGFYNYDRAVVLHEQFRFEGDYLEHHLGEDHYINLRIHKTILKCYLILFPKWLDQTFQGEELNIHFKAWIES